MGKKTIEFVLSLIQDGSDLKINDELICFSDIDDQPYSHSIPEYPDFACTVLRSESWVSERII